MHLTSSLDQTKQIAEIVLQRIDKRNAFDSALLEATRNAVRSLGSAPELRLLILRSACDHVFSAGADLREMAALDARTAANFIRRIHGVCEALVECPVPIVAVIDGACIGAALECDLRLATTQARFSMPEVLVGVPSVVEAARP